MWAPAESVDEVGIDMEADEKSGAALSKLISDMDMEGWLSATEPSADGAPDEDCDDEAAAVM